MTATSTLAGAQAAEGTHRVIYPSSNLRNLAALHSDKRGLHPSLVDETNTALVQSAIYEKLEYLFAENTTLTAANGGLYRTNFDVLLSEAATTL